jgi:anhydro-N-acetylmuramic acid kinase
VSKPLNALGLMSGTSMDGIDVALLQTDGERVFARGPSQTMFYNETQRDLLRRALEISKSIEQRDERPSNLSHIENEVTQWHVEAVESFLQKHDLTHSKIDVIGFHGQTVIHRPERQLTVQIGKGQALANQLGLPVVYDLRANDIALGGQGAPLVPVYHRALVQGMAEKPVAVVNIGGVANVTWIGPNAELMAFDTGPGNALIDDWMKRHTGASRDEGGTMGMVGQVNQHVLEWLLDHPFFARPAPKSLDRNTFAGMDLGHLQVAEGAATLAAFTAQTIANAVAAMPAAPKSWLVCGGGRHNAAIMRQLQNLLPHVSSAEALQLDGDAIEAEAWAFLAARSLRGLDITFPGTTGVTKAATGGILAKPV